MKYISILATFTSSFFQFYPPGSGSAYWIEIRIQQGKIMRIGIHSPGYNITFNVSTRVCICTVCISLFLCMRYRFRVVQKLVRTCWIYLVKVRGHAEADGPGDQDDVVQPGPAQDPLHPRHGGQLPRDDPHTGHWPEECHHTHLLRYDAGTGTGTNKLKVYFQFLPWEQEHFITQILYDHYVRKMLIFYTGASPLA